MLLGYCPVILRGFCSISPVSVSRTEAYHEKAVLCPRALSFLTVA